MINFIFEKFGLVPLHTASKNGKKEIVKLLLEKGANIEAKDNVVIFEFFFAFFFSFFGIVELTFFSI